MTEYSSIFLFFLYVIILKSLNAVRVLCCAVHVEIQ